MPESPMDNLVTAAANYRDGLLTDDEYLAKTIMILARVHDTIVHEGREADPTDTAGLLADAIAAA